MGTWTRLPSSLRGSIALAIRLHSPKPESKPSGGNDSIGIPGIAPTIGDRSIRALEEYGRLLAVLKQRVRIEGAMPRAIPSLDHGRLCRPGVETDAEAIVSVDKGSFVPIGKRTSDKRVHVHEKRLWMCTVASSHVVAAWVVSAPVPPTGVPHRGRRRWTGATPVFGLPGSAFQRVGMCMPMPPCRRVAPVPESIPAELICH